MQLFEGHFWFHGTEMSWNMPLPFCPDCDGDVRALRPHTSTNFRIRDLIGVFRSRKPTPYARTVRNR
jgi:hypothetical protein